MAADKFIKAFTERFNDLEITALEVDSRWNYKTSSGATLDDIAAILKIKRLAASDEDLRRRIGAVSALNSCTGSIESLQQVLKILLNATAVRVLVNGNGMFDLEITGDSIDLWGVDYIRKTPAGGCGVGHMYLYDENTFTFDDDSRGFDLGELAESY